jgi:uncharacterized protein YjbI with pentapeptide repeats
MANLPQLAKLKESIEAWNAWREAYPEVLVDLSGADLRGAVLGCPDFVGLDLSTERLQLANLNGANLSEADLEDATLTSADLAGATLQLADLNGANLSRANLQLANLNGADLSGADLKGANLSGADLKGANLSGTALSETNLEKADLRDCSIYGISAGNLKLKLPGTRILLSLVRMSLLSWWITWKWLNSFICS